MIVRVGLNRHVRQGDWHAQRLHGAAGHQPTVLIDRLKRWDLPLHDEGDLAVHLVEGEVAVLVDVGVAADHLDATDAPNGLRRCLYGVTNCVAERVRRTAYDLADPDDSSRDVVLLL